MDGLRMRFDELAADVPALGDLDRAIEQVERERRRRAGMIASILAAAAVVVVVALLSRGGVPGDPEPAPAPAPSVPVAPAGQQVAVVLRGSTLIAVDTTGRERRMLDLVDLGVSEDGLQYPYVSNAGWLSTYRELSEDITSTSVHEIYDLTHPRTPPRTDTDTFDQRAWSPDGTKLAGIAYSDGLVVIDAVTGERQVLRTKDWWVPGGGPDLIWSLDPSGLLVVPQDADPRDSGEGNEDPYSWGVLPIDGGPVVESNNVPSLDYRSSRYIVRGGRHIVCKDGLMNNCSTEDIVVRDIDGTLTTLYDGQSGSTVQSKTLSFDGHAAYLPRSPEPGVVEVVRAEAGTDPQVLTRIQVPESADPDSYLWMSQVTTDDSAVIVNIGLPVEVSYLVPLDGSQAHPLRGWMIGWMRASAVNAVIGANQ